MASLAVATEIQLAKKAEEIRLVLSGPDVDLWKLRELALTEGGLVNGKFVSSIPSYSMVFSQCCTSLTYYTWLVYFIS
jgi:hypothetical protein